MPKASIIGAGAWGKALGRLASRECETRFWSRSNPDSSHLPSADLVIVAVPAQSVREVLSALASSINPAAPIIITSKGIEQTSLMLMSDIVGKILPGNPIAVLSGPNLAHEIEAGLPAASNLACRDEELGKRLVPMLGGPFFRLYYIKDIISAQVGGAVKNVLAIACGVAEGKNFGENARAGLITRGLAEMVRLAGAMGGRPETLMGLCGIGDLILTCTSAKSRNHTFGAGLAQGKSLQQLLASSSGIVEGYATAVSINSLCAKLKIEMPICESVYKILYESADIDSTIHALLARPLQI